MGLGLNPFILSCHACFAQMFSDDQLQEFLKLGYSELYAEIVEWEKIKAAGEAGEDSFPPNFHSLLSWALKLHE